ncbi:MAG TPA: 2-C-methyl-D-erythritol 2,4-cyclodiphosphate synthase [Candidatus Hydrogenedentes bacterium]|jgi:2-C-methyl-D-erythritol 2,4-cyclodiphosphate synthase|nr:MAG: 2-C-methyl-D-erythritol 2,4-cyclodiphosphate synthase [Candidatus Hydrogenedentes bacterium ADurb.Bin170]HNZ47224.1 2-C-methyl-D-erythritol 2,4-cyclodiphosphate synthase [Candidatus Hydrogenedentota bacterium]HOD94516.1 2-C-methyl-D-erythritol 2,4-cyclodiphosphate synthase [Candidatus Hydrogenedentota bacterium]HOR49892.1 2-C-methyl-D-erythritol 2,4-cyclodiphosphate synthase [Candidatus Hydrogenedentota bacterium]HPK23935.1 2-C-methyl-D-erythritol 2,4-cyclodiphosphate synthase [Candidat
MIRIGIGYDIHRLVPGRKLILGGVCIPHEKGFEAHSDGDVLCHAISDALLGAAGLPNIGVLFPDTDPAYKDADSISLLKNVVRRLHDRGFRPVQMDSNIVAQRPKLKDYVEEMIHSLSAATGMPSENISIKPRTNEHLGAEGREEGISAQVVVVIEKIPPEEA